MSKKKDKKKKKKKQSHRVTFNHIIPSVPFSKEN